MLLRFSDWFIFEVIGFDPASKIGGVLSFFVYDSIKILLLLFGMIFVIGVLRTFLPERVIRQWMGRKGFWGHVFAAVFGAVTPFCSCSSIPLFLGFLKAGIPLGVSFSFLITSPLINEYLVVLMFGFFGWKITAFYVFSGLMIGISSGFILGRMNLERHLVEDWVAVGKSEPERMMDLAFQDRLKFGWGEAKEVTRKIWIWVLLGVGIGAIIHNYVPREMIETIISRAGVFSVPIAVGMGVPMYGSCAAIVPIAVVLFQKGIPLGTALAFMMAVAALSLPEAVMLRRAMRLPLIGIFFAVTTLAIIVIGYVLNVLQFVLA